ncbi:uncharacterized protein LOC105828318 [Monomorium pharaonis]|uniref:uncharacterized protein LOC105828318 n=1 Tax=Monomorium pharaonis TaxID=307658 RepID=UPI00063F33C0|nr:uncharacterized protein LOC105828318 [Monomorium pharaonis]XP_028046845.1 uncharacterized protein LOC105828318 [Monomorium pharaonis]XP_028046846.1 uncharacterized protein LOC105828318 [Monomorium pharaonis]XP_028046847.1 uncharacterized protein LOC105828318 [Monomorium pharaonis]XP_028046848.1 uncharacterized protein LOC105828318 [Monomorium pharaonis]XP_028046849.1 uncharacterized protein LOC105828318 [Monomorium pharaonis]XP_028046850.1 uncharacterized protein LOC105828318 [Monomorium p
MQKDIKDENINKLSCNRTKCTSIINNVIGKSSFNALVDQLRINQFSLLVDESTDHSSVKHLALVIRVNINFQIHDKFLALIEIKNASAQSLYDTIVNFFKENNIPYKLNMIAFAADGAHAMMGRNHSLKTLLTDIPNLFVIKCVYHSLALCVSHACASLPNYLEKFVRNIYTYMQYSFKRQSQFKDFQVFLNLKPHKLLQPAQTRWLSLQLVVNRILEQYEALILYFQAERFDGITAASEIYENLLNPPTKLYLQFLEYVLPIFNDLNLEFQSETPKIYLLYDKMENAYRTLLSYYIKPEYLETTDVTQIQYRNPINYMPLDKIYCGPKVALALEGNNLSNEEEKHFRLRCMDFYINCAHEIYKRFPFNSSEMAVLKLLSFLNPDKISSTETLIHLSIKMPHLITDLNALDREWRSIINMSNKPETKNVINYRKLICERRKGDESLEYPEINKLVSYLLTLPHSSACVERVFSAINLNKTKVRNRLGSATLSGILHSKRLINEHGKNCFNFHITSNVLEHHNKMMY